MNECPNCGEKMQLTDMPRELFRFYIPFTQIEIMIYDFGHKENICIFCATEKQKMPFKEAYDAGFDDGVTEATSKDDW